MSFTLPRVLMAMTALCLASCSSSHVIVGKVRPPISPASVRLYVRPPANYEEVALVEASSQGSWAISRQGKANAAIEGLKEEAAQLGANGLMLSGTASERGPMLMTGNAFDVTSSQTFGVGFIGASRHQTVSGVAIYVP